MKELFITLSNVLHLQKEQRLVYQEEKAPKPMNAAEMEKSAQLAKESGLKVPDFMKTKAEGNATTKKGKVDFKSFEAPKVAAYESEAKLSPEDEIKQNVEKLEGSLRAAGVKSNAEVNEVKKDIRRIANNLRAESGNAKLNPPEVKQFLKDVADLIKQYDGRNVNRITLQTKIREYETKMISAIRVRNS